MIRFGVQCIYGLDAGEALDLADALTELVLLPRTARQTPSDENQMIARFDALKFMIAGLAQVAMSCAPHRRLTRVPHRRRWQRRRASIS